MKSPLSILLGFVFLLAASGNALSAKPPPKGLNQDAIDELKATGLLESGVGRGHTMAVGCLAGVTHLDLAATRWYFRKDVTVNSWELDSGCIVVPDLPGIGTGIDEERLAALDGRSTVRDNT